MGKKNIPEVSLHSLLLFSASGIVFLGFITLFLLTNADTSVSPWFIDKPIIRQVLFFVPAVGIGFYLAYIDYRVFSYSFVILSSYGFVLVLLVVVLFMEGDRPRSWLNLEFSGISFGGQPAEFAKFFVILLTAWYLQQVGERIRHWLYFLGAFFPASCACLLVFAQPDPGTALIIMIIPVAQVFVAGCQGKHLSLLFCSGFVALFFGFLAHGAEETLPSWLHFLYDVRLLLSPNLHSLDQIIDRVLVIFSITCIVLILISIINSYIYRSYSLVISYIIIFSLGVGVICSIGVEHIVKPHHVDRFFAIVDDEMDPLGRDYDIFKNMNSLSVGGAWGQGILLTGDYSEVDYRSNEYTDFIFAPYVQEFGFFGVFLLFTLYSVFIICALLISFGSRDKFGYFSLIGMISVIGFHVIINIGMTLNIFPVIGIPLPFMSYGGSFFVVCLSFVGFMSSVYMRRYYA